MAWATKCDRCGKYFDHHQEVANGIALLSYDITKDRYLIEGEEYDLCPDCIKSFDLWFECEGKG